MKKRVLNMLMAAVLSMTLLAGCGSSTETVQENTKVSESVAETEEQNDVTVTTEEDIELTTEEIKEAQETEQASVEEQQNVETKTEAEESIVESVEETIPETVAYTFTELSGVKYAKQTVNLRDTPSTDGEKIGSLSTGQEVEVLAQCNETGWYKINYKGGEAFVSNKYISDEVVKAATEQAASDSSKTTESVGASETPQISESTTTTNGVMVWIPQSGSKYHSRSGCSNMKNPTEVTREEAERLGYTPCKKCY